MISAFSFRANNDGRTLKANMEKCDTDSCEKCDTDLRPSSRFPARARGEETRVRENSPFFYTYDKQNKTHRSRKAEQPR